MNLDHLTREYSERLGVLSAEQLQRALERFGLGRLQNAVRAPGGAFGQNVLLTSDKGEYVLRGKPHFHWQFGKERFFANLIAERTNLGAPVPFLIDDATDIFGFQYAIMPRLPGVLLDDREAWNRVTDSDQLGIAQAMGRCLAELHSVTWPNCADTDDETGELQAVSSSYRDWISSIVERRIERCRAVSSDMTDTDEAWCRQILASNAWALDVAFQPTLVHHDFKLGNVALAKDNGSWCVSGVFDLTECYFANPEEDLVRQVAFYELPGQHARPGSPFPSAFVQAYAEVRQLRPGFRERFRINMLRDCLLLWDFGLRAGPLIPADSPHVQKWFDPARGFRVFAGRHVRLDPFA